MKKTVTTLVLCLMAFGFVKAQVTYNVYGVTGSDAIQGVLPKDSITLSSVYDLDIDKTGNLYAVDRASNRIFKINPSGQIINIRSIYPNYAYGITINKNNGDVLVTDGNTIIKLDSSLNSGGLIAGNNNYAFSGDGGQATSADINLAAGICYDKLGNIIFSDQYNNCVRKIDVNGIITTIAGQGGTAGAYAGDGGQATACQLNLPSFVTVDYNNNIYIADNSNQRIRKINASKGIITTIAGNGTAGYSGNNGLAASAMINFPKKLVYDSASNSLYFSDQFNYVVRKINLNTNVITVVAGSGVYGNAGDGGIATSAQLSYPRGLTKDKNNNLYIADNGNYKIRKVNLTTNIITKYAGNGTWAGDGHLIEYAAFPSTHLTQDNNGNVYVGINSSVRKINTSGIMTLYAGRNDSTGYSGDGGPATNAKLNPPQYLAVDKNGNVLFSQGSGDPYPGSDTIYCIRKINASTGTISAITKPSYKPDDYTGDGGLASNAQVGYISCMTFDNNNNIYIGGIDYSLSTRWFIRKIDAATGKINLFAGNYSFGGSGYSGDGGLATSALLNGVRDMTVCNNALYFVDGMLVRKIDLSTNIISTYDSTGHNAGTLNHLYLSSDGANNIYEGVQDNTSTTGFQIQKINTSNNSKQVIFNQSFFNTYSGDGGPALIAGSPYLTQISSNASGSNIYITDNGNIRLLTPQNFVAQQPLATLLSCAGDSVKFTSTFATPNSTSYNWQVYNTSTSNYINLQNDNTYNGVNTTTLSINNVNTNLTAHKYRCVAQGYPIVETNNGNLVVHILPTITVNSPSVCLNHSVSITAVGASTYTWSNSMNGASISVSPSVSGNYTVTGSNTYNCKSKAVSNVTVVTPATPNICLVTTDSATFYNYNTIYWDNSQYNGVDSFILYRYDAGVNNYLRIGAVSKDSSRLKDTSRTITGPNGGDPNYTSYKYTLAIRDTCGNIGTQSPRHETVFLQDQHNGNFNINPYVIGAGQSNPVTGYALYRDVTGTGNNFSYVTTITGISATDPTYNSSYVYRVDILGFNCVSNQRLAGGNNNLSIRAKSHSNTSRFAANGIKQINGGLQVGVYPNPTTGMFTIQTPMFENTSVEIYNLVGQKLIVAHLTNIVTQLNLSNLTNGMYQLKIIKNNTVVYQSKIIKID